MEEHRANELSPPELPAERERGEDEFLDDEFEEFKFATPSLSYVEDVEKYGPGGRICIRSI
jgi:hypothetical protein